MQVIVLRTFCPSAGDAVSPVAAALCGELEARGHKCEELLMPFDPACPPLEQILAFRLLEQAEYGDLLISLHPPCHVVFHRRKVIWAVGGALRSDQLIAEGGLGQDPASASSLASLRASDRMAFSEARRIFLCSQASCRSFRREEGLEAVFLPAPPAVAPSGLPKRDVLAASLGSASRVHLLLALEALAAAAGHLRLQLFGELPFSSEQWNGLLLRLDLKDRVEVLPAARWADSIPSALAVLGLSENPDVLGRLAIDAHACGAPLAAFDSPAAAEWIEDGRNGRRAPCDALALASTLNEWTGRPETIASLGRAGRARLEQWGANWDRVVSAITAS